MTEISVCAQKGKRETMEDRHLVNVDFFGDGKLQLYAIFDGHGGSATVQFLEKNFENVLRDTIVAEKQKGTIDYAQVLQKTFKVCDDMVNSDFAEREEKEGYCADSGSTAAVVLISENREIFCANVGDTEFIITGLSQPLVVATTQHKPNFVDEETRIRAAGGYVSMYGVPRVNGSLAVSRAFGNCRLQSNNKKIIDAVPSIWKGVINKGDVAILACDGLWDVYSYAEAVQETLRFFENNKLELKGTASFLTEKAIKEKSSNDNVSVIIMRFNDSLESKIVD